MGARLMNAKRKARRLRQSKTQRKLARRRAAAKAEAAG